MTHWKQNALCLYESKFGRKAAEELILEGTDGTLTFTNYPTDPGYLTSLRKKSPPLLWLNKLAEAGESAKYQITEIYGYGFG